MVISFLMDTFIVKLTMVLNTGESRIFSSAFFAQRNVRKGRCLRAKRELLPLMCSKR